MKIELRERHGFLTFLFIAGIVFGIISILLIMMLAFNIIDEKAVDENMAIYLFYGLLMFVPYILLLRWKMLGFILNCVFSVLLAIIIIMASISDKVGSVFDIVSIIVSPLILYFLLQLKKNNVPAWAYLRGKTTESFRTKKDNAIKDALICKSCQKTFSTGYTYCPYCSSTNIEVNSNVIIENSEIKDIPIVRTIVSVELKKCRNCGEKVNEDIFKCPKCKGESFI
jgi:RNA polymerase subunit RPABC4/transcription elongation factor Spt4